MANNEIDRRRQVVPRWRSFGHTAELESLAIPKGRAQDSLDGPDWLHPKLALWQSSRTTPHALDVIGAAIVLGREAEVCEPVRFLQSQTGTLLTWAKLAIDRALLSNQAAPDPRDIPSPEFLDQDRLRAQIHDLRILQRDHPRDTLTWVELSRLYAISGVSRSAERCMEIALQLRPNNRFILRAACRMWLHLGQPDRAHDTVAQSPLSRSDPWLMAAELASAGAAERLPLFVKRARTRLAGSKDPARHLSELAAALGTLEFEAGKARIARRLMGQALEDPTENAVAQVEWVSRKDASFQVSEVALSSSHAFEARAWRFYYDHDWRSAIQQCRLWQFDQPFSSRPGLVGSFIAAVVLEDFQSCEAFSRMGIVSNEDDVQLHNNLAYSLINLGRIAEANAVLVGIRRRGTRFEANPVLSATEGLLSYRLGNIDRGRWLYSQAIEHGGGIEGKRIRAFAAGFFALEELAHGSTIVEGVVDNALKWLGDTRDPAALVLRSRLLKAVSDHNSRGGKEKGERTPEKSE